MGDDHSGWIAVLEIPGIPQIWVEEWIGKSATITKIPIWTGSAGSRVASVYVRSEVHFFILLVVQVPHRYRGKVSEQNSHFQPSGEVQIPRGVEQKTS